MSRKSAVPSLCIGTISSCNNGQKLNVKIDGDQRGFETVALCWANQEHKIDLEKSMLSTFYGKYACGIGLSICCKDILRQGQVGLLGVLSRKLGDTKI